MAVFDENHRSSTLQMLPSILNLDCYLADTMRWATFSSYNADIRAMVKLWEEMLAAPQSDVVNRWITFYTAMYLFY